MYAITITVRIQVIFLCCNRRLMYGFSTAVASANETSGFELQTAYGVSTLVSCLTFIQLEVRISIPILPPQDVRLRFMKREQALCRSRWGYFTFLDKSHNWIFETYAGAGTGAVNNDYRQSESSRVNVSKQFIQPSVGYINKAGTFEAAIASRFSNVSLDLKSSTVTSNNSTDDFQQVQDIRNNSNNVYWEPSLLLRVGGRNVKFQCQYTASTGFKQRAYLTQPAVLSLGIMFSINGKMSK